MWILLSYVFYQGLSRDGTNQNKLPHILSYLGKHSLVSGAAAIKMLPKSYHVIA